MTKDEAIKLALEALEKDPAPLNAINNAKCFLYSALEQPEQEPVAWAPRELELIDGMIETQLRHADVCDHIANRVMAQKQKGWDMERVELLRKIKNMPLKQEFVCSTGLCHYKHWVGLTDAEIFDVIRSLCADNETAEMLIDISMDEYRAIEAKLKEKNT